MRRVIPALLALAGSAGCEDHLDLTVEFRVTVPDTVIAMTRSNGEPLESWFAGFRLVERATMDAPITVIATYTDNTTTSAELVPGQRCTTYCTFADCDGYGALLREDLGYEVSPTAIESSGSYACEWVNGNVTAGP